MNFIYVDHPDTRSRFIRARKKSTGAEVIIAVQDVDRLKDSIEPISGTSAKTPTAPAADPTPLDADAKSVIGLVADIKALDTLRQLRAGEANEQTGKKRATVLKAIDARIAALETPAGTTAE